MSRIDARFLLLAGFVLLLLGFLLPLLMIMQFLPSTFFLNFLAYAMSFFGLMTGVIGSVMIAARYRRK
jgi:hypothetical protein